MFDDNDLKDFTNFTKPKNIIRNLNKNGFKKVRLESRIAIDRTYRTWQEEEEVCLR